jgi:Concanavalin A-like lectin/glucanases superfamily
MSHWVLLVAPLALASFVMLFAFVGCFLDSTGQAPPTTYSLVVVNHRSLVGYWRLHEAAGETAALDAKGDNDGTYVGGVTLEQPGLVLGSQDPAALFDGSTGYVSVPFAEALNPFKFTVEALVDIPTVDNQFRAVVSSRDIGEGAIAFGYILYVSDQNNWQAWVGDGTGPVWQVVTGPDVTPGQHHVAMTYDGTTLKLYVDAIEVDAPATADVVYQPNATRELRIGSGANEAADPLFFFNGVLDEVAVYNIDLDFATIAEHVGLTMSGPQPPP